MAPKSNNESRAHYAPEPARGGRCRGMNYEVYLGQRRHGVPVDASQTDIAFADTRQDVGRRVGRAVGKWRLTAQCTVQTHARGGTVCPLH